MITASVVGGTAAYLGSLMITRRMALVGDALGHVALPGMGLALLLSLDTSVGALAFLSVGTLLIWRLSENTQLSLETLVGIVFVTSLALGFLIVPQPELLESLIGDISKVTPAGMVLSIAVSAVVSAVVHRIFPGMMLLSISEDLAAVQGISRKRYELIYLAAVALIVSIGVKVTGSLLVGALVIVPPATARLLSSSLASYGRLSALLGLACSAAGIVASRLTGFPAGPAIILACSASFVAVLLVKPRFRTRA
jgi:ABC-type Mn2+/Zn2+ transport system permease subunit